MNDNQIDIAREKLSDWLKERGEINGDPEFLLGIKEEEIEDRIFFAFRYKKNAGGDWLIGVAGGFEDEDDLECPITFGNDFECPDDREDQASVALYLAIFTLQKQKAQDELCHYLATREEMDGEEPEEIEYRCVIRGESIDNRIFFVFKFKKPDDDKWYIGVSGGYENEESLERPLPFSGFDEFPENEKDAIGYAFAIAEFILKMASGSARNSIQDAVAQNLKYIHSPADPEKIAGQFVMTQSRFFLSIGAVDVPSGRVIVSDPLVYLPGNRGTAPILEKEIPKGSYRVEVSILRSKQIGTRICTARMKIKETRAVRYELAIPTRETAEPTTEDGVICGFTVDAGLISFIDADGAEAYRKVDKEWWDSHPGGNRYDDYFKALFQESYERIPDFQREGGDFIQWMNPENNERMVMVASGLGDGYYLCFWGYDEDDEICELTVPMLDPDLFEDLNDDYHDEDDEDNEDDEDDEDDDDDDLNELWQEAYRANPRLYEMEKGGMLVNFALTEDTDSLFPLVPKEHWAIEDKEIDKWILSIVSITKDGVLGTIEYHEAMKRLEKYFLAKKDGWALIRGLTLDELEELFDGLPKSALN